MEKGTLEKKVAVMESPVCWENRERDYCHLIGYRRELFVHAQIVQYRLNSRRLSLFRFIKLRVRV